MHPEKNHVRRQISDAAFHLGLVERILRSARKSGANGSMHIQKVEEGARDLRRLTRRIEAGQ